MDSATRMICFALVFAFLCLACMGCAADTAQQPAGPTSAKTKAELRLEEKARAAEQLEARREAAAKAEREAAAKAKAKREEKARLAKLSAEAEKQAKDEIAQAKREKEASLSQVQAKGIKAERARLKRKLNEDKTKAAVEHKQAVARAKKDKATLEAEYTKYKQTVARLDAEYKGALAKLKEKADAQAAQIAQAKRQDKAGLATLDAKAKRQAKEIDTEKANLKRKLSQDRAKRTAEYKKAKARPQTKEARARLDAEYKRALRQLESQYKGALAEFEKKADAQAGQIAAAKRANKTRLADLDARAKEQAKNIKTQEADLKRKLSQDKSEAKIYGIAKLDADYKDKIRQLETAYKRALARLEERADAQAAEAAEQRKQIEADYQEKVARINLRLIRRKQEAHIAGLKLPEDTSPLMTVRELRISGNSLVSTAELLKNMPLVYNASDKPLREADSQDLYDFRVLHDVIQEPGQPRQVSTRTIQGLTQYVLSMYQEKNYAGVYVYVPAEAVETNSPAELKGGILPIEVLEAEITDITVRTYDPDQNPTEKGYLRTSAVKKWSPVKVGEVTNQKELDEFVNLLNLNPDRYVSAVASKGREPGSLMVSYDIYEANPWHYFLQADNSGTSERQWNPRIGIINTNLFGIDDTFTTVYQAPWDSEIDENYSLYGSYDFPVLGPQLRLNLYAGHSEFDISPETGLFGFLGRGTVYGGTLRYNVLQKEGWFFDIKGTMEHTRSKITPSLFPAFLGTDIQFWLWGAGLDIHRQDDMSDTSLTFDHFKSLGGESSAAEFALARTNAQTLFSIYSTSATHSQYLDPNKVHRASGTFRWIGSDERLVPARMTSFGGMYTVRGYDEYEFVADGGILASAQYEFDLVKYEESKNTAEAGEAPEEGKKPLLKKLAPLAFVDYGRANIKSPVGTEKAYEELFSIGAGTIVELGDNFSGAIYYGYPLAKTDTTRKGKGRISVGVMLRW